MEYLIALSDCVIDYQPLLKSYHVSYSADQPPLNPKCFLYHWNSTIKKKCKKCFFFQNFQNEIPLHFAV